MLRYPQDSFDGLSPHVEYHRSPYVTLLQPTLDGKMLYPAKQVWFGSGYVRLSDDYNCVDISCSVRTVTKLLSVELCHNYLIGLYEAYNAGWAKLVVFKLPTAKRRYEKTEQSIQVKAYSDKDTNVVFETEEMQSVQLVGIDKISEQIFYNIGNQLYQCPLCLPDPRKVTTPDNLEFKKIVSPSCFISLFLTHDGDVWYRTHKISKDVSDAFNYQWGRLEFLRGIENIAIERWPELGKFGLALMTHDGALLCECCPDEKVPFIVWSKTANPQRFYQLEEGEKSERLYLHNKEVTLLKSGPEWVQVPIAWS
jgi:hypothetical protein